MYKAQKNKMKVIIEINTQKKRIDKQRDFMAKKVTILIDQNLAYYSQFNRLKIIKNG